MRFNHDSVKCLLYSFQLSYLLFVTQALPVTDAAAATHFNSAICYLSLRRFQSQMPLPPPSFYNISPNTLH